MLRDAAVDLIMDRMSKTQTSIRDIIIREMALAQETVLEMGDFRPWFLVSEFLSANTTASEERLQVPTDFIGEWEEGTLYRIDSANTTDTYIDMVKDDYDHIKDKYPGTGAPTHYDIAGDYFLLRPLPDAVYPMKIKCYVRAASLAGTYGDANNIENLWLKWASDWVIGEVGYVMTKQYYRDEELAAGFLEQIARGKTRVMNRDTAIREDNKDRNMGDS